MCTELRRAETWGCQGTVLGRGIGHWSPWLNHGVPQPLSHAPICETSVCRVQGPGPWHLEGMAVWKGTRPGRRGVGKEGPMGGSGRRDGQGAKFWGAKTRDSGSDVSGRQHPSPNSSLALTTHKRPADKDSLLPTGSFPCRLRSPLGGHLTHPFTFFRLVSDQDLAPLPPPPASQ